MSYYATADGNIKLKNRLSEKRLEELIDILIEVFEDYDTEDDSQKVFFGGHIKYDDDMCLNYCQMSPTNMKSRKARLITLEKIPLCGVISLLTESGRNRAVKWYIHKRALETKKGIVYETEE